MGKILYVIWAYLLCRSTLLSAQCVDSLVVKMKAYQSNQVMVISHRGDWRNAPENSLLAFRNCIEMGIDMIELDLKKTRDGYLILMHDSTIDRTTNGEGSPTEYTLEEIKQFRLVDGLGRVTNHSIPTLNEVFALCKGKILINIDKGYDYFKEVYTMVEEYGMNGQVIIKSGYPLDKVCRENGDMLDKIVYVPIVNLNNPDAEQILDSYLGISPVAVECCFKTYTPEVMRLLLKIKSAGTKIWLNSMWSSLNAGHDDDRAVEEKDKEGSWGWLIEQGAMLIQTDRPQQLVEYLRRNGLHY